MPWKETCVMDARKRFVLKALAPEACMAALCREFGISRKSGYKCGAIQSSRVGRVRRSVPAAPSFAHGTAGERRRGNRPFALSKIAPERGPVTFKIENLDFSKHIPWQPFSDENVAKVRELGRPGFIDFTADW